MLNIKKTLSIALTLILVLGAVFVFTTGVSQAADEEFDILIMPKLEGIPYFNNCEKGAEQAGEDLGVNVIYAGPSKVDASAQIKMIEDYLNRGIDALAVAPNDPAALSPVLEKAQEQGVVVMDWDTPAEQSLVDYSVRQISYQEYGEHVWDLLVRAMGSSEGKYAVLTGGLGAANLNQWIDYGLDYAEDAYPDLELIQDRIPTNEQKQVAYQKTLNLLKTYPDLKGIVGISTPAPLGAAQAVQERGLSEEIAVVGTTNPKSACPYLKSGALDYATLWEPAKLGYLAVWVATQELQGNEITETEIDYLDAEISVDGKKIIMGPPADFTADNCDQFNF